MADTEARAEAVEAKASTSAVFKTKLKHGQIKFWLLK